MSPNVVQFVPRRPSAFRRATNKAMAAPAHVLAHPSRREGTPWAKTTPVFSPWRIFLLSRKFYPHTRAEVCRDPKSFSIVLDYVHVQGSETRRKLAYHPASEAASLRAEGYGYLAPGRFRGLCSPTAGFGHMQRNRRTSRPETSERRRSHRFRLYPSQSLIHQFVVAFSPVTGV